MKRTCLAAVFTTLILLASAQRSDAIEQLRIAIRQTNVVLAWPSVTNETFIIQHRTTLDTNDVWETLAVAYPAEANTNWTRFVHTNQVTVPVQQGGGTNGGGGGSPPGPMSMTSGGSGSGLTTSRRVIAPPPPPPTLPPLPWESTALRSTSSSLISLNSEGGGSANAESIGPAVSQGFYRVVRTGLHLVGVTNGIVLAGETKMPIEMGLTNGMLEGASLLLNYTSMPATQIITNELGLWTLSWDTTATTNAIYPLYLYGELPFNGGEFYAPTNWMTVSNVLSFVHESLFNDHGIGIMATWYLPEAVEWFVRLYAENGTEIVFHVGAQQVFLSGVATNGQIDAYWDLTDPQGNHITNTTIRGDFYVRTQGTTGAQATEPTGKKVWTKDNGWSQDDFVIALAHSGSIYNPSAYKLMIRQGVVDVLDVGVNQDGYKLSPGNAFHDNSFFMDTEEQRLLLLSYLADASYRNFYWFGHGGRYSIGDFGPGSTNTLRITDSQIAAVLGNHPDAKPYRYDHPYRLVILDGCKTALGTLSASFAISRNPHPMQWYLDNNMKASAFVGLTGDSVIPSGMDTTYYAETLAEFWVRWRSGTPLDVCCRLGAARTRLPFPPSYHITGCTNIVRFPE